MSLRRARRRKRMATAKGLALVQPIDRPLRVRSCRRKWFV
jgi:hypothetical protein